MPNNGITIEYGDISPGGGGKTFAGDSIRSIRIMQSLDLISSELQINTADLTLELDDETAAQVTFAEGDQLKLKRNETLFLVTFIKEAKQTSRNLWSIKSEDYIGKLADVMYHGDIYNGTTAANLQANPPVLGSDVLAIIDDIFDTANVPYEISPSLETALTGEKIKGWIPYTDCRTAIMQIAFAFQFCVTTSGKETVYLYLQTSSTPKDIDLSSIRQGQKVDNAASATAIEIYYHSFASKWDAEEEVLFVVTAEDAGKNITVVFSSPYEGLRLQGQGYSAVTFTGKNANYATLSVASNFDGRVSLLGYQINDYTYPYISSQNRSNVKSISKDATLVHEINVAGIATHIQSVFASAQTADMTVIDRPTGSGADPLVYGSFYYGDWHYGDLTPYVVQYDNNFVDVGDYIEAETDYSGTFRGYVTQSTFDLKNGIIDRKIVVLGSIIPEQNAE